MNGRVGALEVAAREDAAYNTVTELVHLNIMSMPFDKVGSRVHEQVHIGAGEAKLVVENLDEDFVGEEAGAVEKEDDELVQELIQLEVSHVLA